MGTQKHRGNLVVILAGAAGVAVGTCLVGVIASSLGSRMLNPTPLAAAPAIAQVPSTSPASKPPAATKAPAATKPPTAPPAPVRLQGSGQYATDPVRLPASISVAELTHSGGGNFIVWAYQQGGGQELLVNAIGGYHGRVPVNGDSVSFDIDADGPWSIVIAPIPGAGPPAFAGRGDDVSPLFDPPGGGPWELRHDGAANFVVWCHCAGGSSLVENEIGAVSGSRIVQFRKGPCFWQVSADGAWSLRPR